MVLFRRALQAGAACNGSAYRVDDYPAGGSAYLYPFRIKAVYDDRRMGLDRNDYILAEFQCSTGWNSMEETAFVSYDFYARAGIPLCWRFSAFFTAESFLTTADERLFGRYVFTGLMSCRRDEYTSAPVAHSAGAGITIELMREHVYLSPGIYYGMYSDESGSYKRASCAGGDIQWDTGAISIALRINKEIGGQGDVVYMVSAGGRF